MTKLNPLSRPAPPAAAPAPGQVIPAAVTPLTVPTALVTTPASDPQDVSVVQGRKTKPLAKAAVSFPDKASVRPASGQTGDINTRAVFFNGSAATGPQIDAVLRRYNSPHVGKGDMIARICREQNINPILMLAVMQQESSYGNRSNTPSLKDENIANPWSVHFNEGAQGIAKLRLPDGSMPSFEQSLRGAIRTLKNLSGDSETPLSTAGRRYSTTGSWTASVTQHFQTQQRRIAAMP